MDHNDNGKYGGKTKSDLEPTLPTEATDPAFCGVLSAAPAGGAETGLGGADTGADLGLLALGGGLVLAAAGAGAVAARKSRAHA